MQRGEEYDEVWCVLDVENVQRRPILEKAERAARDNDVKLCLSNPCFEVWLLAHFKATNKAFRGCDRVIRDELNKVWQQHTGTDYDKTATDIFDKVSDLMETALSNAKHVREKLHGTARKSLDCNSSTDVYRLVAHLLGR